MADIDILIPVYNGAVYIQEAISSIQAQSLSSIRIIVVDDGSTDGTHAILAQIAATDSRVHVLRKDNSGIVDALNAGLAICTADLIARHDADDIAFSVRLEDQAHYLNHHIDCVAVASNALFIDERGERVGSQTEFRGEVRPDSERAPAREPYLMHPFLMARRSALVAIDGYRHVFHAEDTDLYWRLLAQGRLYNLDRVHGEYRLHSGSISSLSTLNGRIAAINSQLAAISYRRRQAGMADLTFTRAALDEFRRAESLESMLLFAARELSSREAAWLQIAATAKLAELSGRRPYALSTDDYMCIATAWREYRGSLSPSNRKFLGELLARRLLVLRAQGRADAAAALSNQTGLAVTAVTERVKRSIKAAVNIAGLKRG